MATQRSWAVLLSIRQQHAANIYAGTKTAELRKTTPRFAPGGYDPATYPFRVYMYESKQDGGIGAVTGYFDCTAYIGVKPQNNERYPAFMAQEAQVSQDYLEKYGAGGWVYAWKVKNPHRLPYPVQVSALGVKRPPQSWQFLDAEACDILEVAARESP